LDNKNKIDHPIYLQLLFKRRGYGLFKPKVYKSNGLEAHHLINDEGGSFLYEGDVEYSEEELFKDEQGRTFYLVTTEIGGPAKYYVEVEAEGRPIPAQGSKKEKDISDLVMASPREKDASEEPALEPEPPIMGQRDTCFESPESVVEPGPEPEAAPQQSTTEEAQAAVKAMASLGEHKPNKNKKSGLFSLPVILALVILIVAITVAGIYIYKPGLISGLNVPFITAPTTEPTATPEPTPVATPEPTPDVQEYDLLNSLLAIGPLIDANNTSVIWFTTNHTNKAGGSYSDLAKACDLFDHVNDHWTLAQGGDSPQYAGECVETLEGDDRDYSILMASLTQAMGFDSRVVAAYDGNSIRYYPEIIVGLGESNYTDTKNYLRGRYDITEPSFHVNGNTYWLGMAMGDEPGVKVDATDQYFVDWKMNIEKL
jgi:hypothetical protein